MIIFAVESSYAKGMGHLYRSLRICKIFKKKDFLFLINNHGPSLNILKKERINFKKVDFKKKNWENKILKKYKINLWINDRLNTNASHSKKIINYTRLITFDDLGSGAKYSDVNFCPLIFKKKIPGKNVYRGLKYLPFDNSLKKYFRKRNKLKKILILIGGSDNRRLSFKLANFFNKKKIVTRLIIGPAYGKNSMSVFRNTKTFSIKKNVKNIFKEYYNYDLLVCSGGMSPFEAASTGLPSMIIATEKFEIPVGLKLKKMGVSKFMGFYKNINYSKINIDLNILEMSKNCLKIFDLKGLCRIKNIINNEIKL